MYECAQLDDDRVCLTLMSSGFERGKRFSVDFKTCSRCDALILMVHSSNSPFDVNVSNLFLFIVFSFSILLILCIKNTMLSESIDKEMHHSTTYS